MTNEPPLGTEQQSAEHYSASERRRSLWTELGLSELKFLDESLAPEVDESLLRRLVRRELPEIVVPAVYRRILSFKSWHRAHAQIVLDEFRKLPKAARYSTASTTQ